MSSSMTNTLRDELIDLESQTSSSPKWNSICEKLHELITTYGPDAEGPWCVVRTAFHNGGEISRHDSIVRALAEVHRYASGECQCGCVGVAQAVELDDLPFAYATKDPYALAR